jgi:hypothetical protein
LESVKLLESSVSFEVLFSPLEPVILEAKQYLKNNKDNIHFWKSQLDKIRKAKSFRSKEESLKRPLQKREPFKLLVMDLCKLLRPKFPPTKKTYEDGRGKAEISQRACDIVADLINCFFFSNNQYLIEESGTFIPDKRVEPVTGYQVKKTFHDRKKSK